MIGHVAIRNDVAGVRDGHVTEQEDGFDIGRLGAVLRLDQIFNIYDGIVPADVDPRHHPAVTNHILLEQGQFV